MNTQASCSGSPSRDRLLNPELLEQRRRPRFFLCRVGVSWTWFESRVVTVELRVGSLQWKPLPWPLLVPVPLFTRCGAFGCLLLRSETCRATRGTSAACYENRQPTCGFLTVNGSVRPRACSRNVFAAAFFINSGLTSGFMELGCDSSVSCHITACFHFTGYWTDNTEPDMYSTNSFTLTLGQYL